MNRRDFLNVGAMGVVGSLIRPGVAAQQPVTVAIHFVGLHMRVHESAKRPGEPELHTHDIVTLRGGGHRTLMVIRRANIASGGLGYVDPLSTSEVIKWQLTGRYDCPIPIEPTSQTAAPSMDLRCPSTAAQWQHMKWLFDARAAGARLKKNWAFNPAVDAAFRLNRQPNGSDIGEFAAEPPIKPRDRKALWKVSGKRQALTDRFVYRVKTETPEISSAYGRVVLKPDGISPVVDIFVLTAFDGPVELPPENYPNGHKLAHAEMAHPLLDGTKPMPRYIGNCETGECSDVEEAAKIPSWVSRGVDIRTSLDTYCPGISLP